MTADAAPIQELPAGYTEDEHLVLTRPVPLIVLNVLSLVLMAPFFVLMALWTGLIIEVRGPFSLDVLAGVPEWVRWIGVFSVLLLHEWIHGLAIRRVGHTPRYGWKTAGIGPLRVPVVLYATADGAYFRRDEFLVVALAPLVVITLAGLLIVALMPDALGVYVSVAVMLNGGGAIGDLWMSAVALGYPRHALVLDEADSIRIYTGPE